MNSKEISRCLLADVHTRRVFRGIFPRDRLPQRINARCPSAYVINTDRSSGPGQHWVCVWFNGRGRAEYFDSFGLPPTHPSIENFILRHSTHYTYNQRLLQSLISSACGLYVLYYIMMKSRGARLVQVQRVFDINRLWSNDRRVWSLMQQLRRRS